MEQPAQGQAGIRAGAATPSELLHGSTPEEVREGMPVPKPINLMGKLKMLKPFKFKSHGQWTDGFMQHGIFEIIEKRANGDKSNDPKCTIRRIATCNPNCPLGETWRTCESYLAECTVPVTLDNFKAEAGDSTDIRPETNKEPRMVWVNEFDGDIFRHYSSEMARSYDSGRAGFKRDCGEFIELTPAVRAALKEKGVL